jgi:hypothetical protein
VPVKLVAAQRDEDIARRNLSGVGSDTTHLNANLTRDNCPSAGIGDELERAWFHGKKF